MQSKNRLLTMAAAMAATGAWVFAAANPVQAQTVVHVRTADLKASDTANMQIEPVRWYGGAYYHSYYRAPYRAYYGGPYRAYYGGAYRAWYGNPYYAYWRYPAYYAPRYYGPTYYGYPGYSAYYAPTIVPNVYPYPAPVVVAPYGGFYW